MDSDRIPQSPFQSKEEVKAAISSLVDFIKTFSRGDSIPLEVIEEVIGITKNTGSWSYITHKARRQFLRDTGTATWVLRPGFLSLLTSSQAVRLIPLKRHQKMFRQTSKMLAEISGAKASELSVAERRLRMSQMERAEAERKQIRKSIKEMRAVDRPTQVSPRIKAKAS